MTMIRGLMRSITFAVASFAAAMMAAEMIRKGIVFPGWVGSVCGAVVGIGAVMGWNDRQT